VATSRFVSGLEELNRSPVPAALRFDDGPPLPPHVAVLPSAYNPPTIAHLRLLALAAGLPGVGGVAALLTTRNVDKDLTGAGLAHRVGMLLAARESRPGLAVLTTNAARFVDQAAGLRSAFPEVRFDFVAGYDTLVRIFEPRYYSDMHGELPALFASHSFVVTNRGDVGLEAVRAFLEREDVRPYAGSIVTAELDGEAAALSSTQARSHAALGRHPESVPPAVAAYIREHRLYREG
jgi:nicotinic acid mononucleotide adenylyltransferase